MCSREWRTAGHQHFFMLVLLYDLLRILLNMDVQEVLKARVNSMSLCLGSNLCQSYYYIEYAYKIM